MPEFVTMVVRGSLAKALVSPAAELVEARHYRNTLRNADGSA